MSLIKNMQIIYHEKVQESTKSGALYPWQVACKMLINNTLQLCKVKKIRKYKIDAISRLEGPTNCKYDND